MNLKPALLKSFISAAAVIQAQPGSQTVNQTMSVTLNLLRTRLTRFLLNILAAGMLLLATGLFGAGSLDLTNGLVAYYPFNGNAQDESGNNHHGSVVGPMLAADRFGATGHAYLFDGVNDHIIVSSRLTSGNPFTWCAWIKPSNSSITQTSSYILSQQNSSTQISPNLGFNYPNGKIHFFSYTYQGFVTYSQLRSSWDTSQWMHVVVTSDPSGQRKIFINGSLDGSASGQEFGEQNASFIMGCDIRDGAYSGAFAGHIDDVRVYNRALSATDVQALYASEATVQFTAQPQSQTVNLGQGAIFSVTATGLGPLTYQWFKDSVAISGAIESSLRIASAGYAHRGMYRVQVSDGVTVADSTEVGLRLVNEPVVELSPSGSSVMAVGTPFKLSIAAISGAMPMTYQWRKNGVNIAAARAASLNFKALLSADTGVYDCLVSNSVATTLSPSLNLRVLRPPMITHVPRSRAILAGQYVTLAVVVKSEVSMTLQWYKDGVMLDGATNATHAFTAEAGTNGVYTLEASNEAGKVTTAPIILTLLTPLVISQEPSDAIAAEGYPSSFSVQVEGAKLAYQWRRNGVDLKGETQSTLRLAAVKPTDAAGYDVVVKSGSLAVLSRQATLTVRRPLRIIEPLQVTWEYGYLPRLSLRAEAPGVLQYKWFKNGKALSPELTADENSEGGRILKIWSSYDIGGVYHVVVLSGSEQLKSNTLVIDVPIRRGVLIYRLAATGSENRDAKISSLAYSGILILDPENSGSSWVRLANSASAKLLSVRSDLNLRLHSTARVAQGSTLCSGMSGDGNPGEYVTSWALWLWGQNTEVAFNDWDIWQIPLRMDGHQLGLLSAPGLNVQTLSVIATLDRAASARARLLSQSLEEATNEQVSILLKQGYVIE